MPGVQRNDGSYFFMPAAAEMAWQDLIPTTAYCAHCPGLVFEGTAAECVAWNRTHRERAHPGLRSRSQFERKQAARAAAL